VQKESPNDEVEWWLASDERRRCVTSAKDASIEPESATSGMPVSPVPGSLAGGPRSGF
jgi:hypothetical protein